MRLGEATHMQVESIPTGSLSLDMAPASVEFPKRVLLRSLVPILR